MSGAVLPCDVF